MNFNFDLSFVGFQYQKIQAGIYRVSHEIFKRLYNNKEINLSYSVFGYEDFPMVNQDVENYLIGNDFSIIPKLNIRKRRAFLPFRKEKFFKFIYKKLGIGNYTQHLNKDLVSDIDIYYSVFYPIPDEIKKQKHIKKIITIHDTIPFIINTIDNNLMKDIINSIDDDTFVLSVSHNTKKDLLYYAPHIKEENVFVCPLAASPEIFYPCKDNQKFQQIRKKYNLPDKYILSLSTLEPRKNMDHLIRCFLETIAENNIDDLYLVMVGKKGWNYDKIFEEYENAKKNKDRIIFTDFADDQDLASIYSHSQAFYYMSLYEGFGLPPLEAMQCGVPVVVSDNSSLPEVVGDAGILIDAKDKTKLCQTIKKLYFDEDFRKKLSEKSLLQSRKFSWEKTTENYIEICKKILQ